MRPWPALRTGRWTGTHGDDGQIALLVLVDAVVAIALVLVAGAATQLHLARTHLVELTDAAALDAADALDEPTYYASGVMPGQGVPLDDTGVRASAESLLARSPLPADLVGVAVADPTGSPDGLSAEVTLTALVLPSLLPRWVAVRVEVPLQVTSRAREGLVLP